MPEFSLHGVADLKENEKKLISAGKTKILVLRHQGKLSAFQGKCPHAGGPLEKGAICNGRLVCPWHMGTFRIPDGRLIEPPAMDSLKTYPLRIEDSKASLHFLHLRQRDTKRRSRHQQPTSEEWSSWEPVQPVRWPQRRSVMKDFAVKSSWLTPVMKSLSTGPC